MDRAYYTARPGSAEHRAAYVEEFENRGGDGYPSPDADEAYYLDNSAEIDADRAYDREVAEFFARQERESGSPCFVPSPFDAGITDDPESPWAEARYEPEMGS